MPEIGLLALGIASILMGCLGVLLVPFSLPGNWLIAATGLFGPTLGLGWTPFFVLLGAAVLAEGLEFFLAARATKRAGGTRAAQWGAFLGGVLGAIVGTPLLPIPILGTLLGSAVGAFVGALLLEVGFTQKQGHELLGVGFGAFMGVFFGKGAKMALGAFQVVYWALAVVGNF